MPEGLVWSSDPQSYVLYVGYMLSNRLDKGTLSPLAYPGPSLGSVSPFSAPGAVPTTTLVPKYLLLCNILEENVMQYSL